MQKITAGNVVSDALKRCDEGNWVGALRDISGLIECTAKAEHGVGGKKVFKEWVEANTRLIMAVTTDGRLGVERLNIKMEHRDIQTVDGSAPFPDIVHHAIRCALAHDGLNPEMVEFTGNRIGSSVAGGPICLLSSVVTGLVLAVLGSAVHADQKLPMPWTIGVGPVVLDLQRFWGKGEELFDAFRYAVNVAYRPISSQPSRLTKPQEGLLRKRGSFGG